MDSKVIIIIVLALIVLLAPLIVALAGYGSTAKVKGKWTFLIITLFLLIILAAGTYLILQ